MIKIMGNKYGKRWGILSDGNLKLLSDDAEHSLDGTEASHKLLLCSVHLVGIIIVIIITNIIIRSIVIMIFYFIIVIIIIPLLIIIIIMLTWQARLLSRNMPAR